MSAMPVTMEYVGLVGKLVDDLLLMKVSGPVVLENLVVPGLKALHDSPQLPAEVKSMTGADAVQVATALLPVVMKLVAAVVTPV